MLLWLSYISCQIIHLDTDSLLLQCGNLNNNFSCRKPWWIAGLLCSPRGKVRSSNSGAIALADGSIYSMSRSGHEKKWNKIQQYPFKGSFAQLHQSHCSQNLWGVRSFFILVSQGNEAVFLSFCLSVSILYHWFMNLFAIVKKKWLKGRGLSKIQNSNNVNRMWQVGEEAQSASVEENTGRATSCHSQSGRHVSQDCRSRLGNCL